MTTNELLETYYKGLQQKKGWESVISDDFKFVGGDMTKTDPVLGKSAKEMIVEGDRAFVRANYDYVFPNGRSMSGDVAELWRVRDGKLDSLTIFFDTGTFQANVR